ncbi:MAG: FMN-binding protein [Gordonibacter sp.]|nr:FMN-binding protein [Gordonibacter sp.]
MKKTAMVACGAAALALGLSGCANYEGTGSKDAASAEQLAMRLDDPWAEYARLQVDPAAKAQGSYADGVYIGKGKGMDGLITATLLIESNHLTCIATTQEGESQSVGGYEAIRDGVYASLIDAAQGSDIDTVTGATITTAGVRQAVDNALEQARQ